ncbi:Retrotransposon protein, Ty3-gypsy subclass [Gossypium australe]|uniref:Retrotransposon protein, Ty3-gypsy subclass n=1 Tax=Gossypium australe TaxID=47621 RepID=A0A5B6VLX5_9ROSI|nr:Retrotransposon protein, Ty3-gypsy subclass [Gossypium australe]
MEPYKALYKCKCRAPLSWSKLSERKIFGTNLIYETKDKVRVIRDCLKASSDRKKLKGKLNSRFIGPYEILKRIRPVAYSLALPPELKKIHNVFHVSVLRPYYSDTSHVITSEKVELQPNLSYNEEPVRILA